MPILLDGYEGQYDWITHTFRYGGVRLTMNTVEDCFNVQVDHYVRSILTPLSRLWMPWAAST